MQLYFLQDGTSPFLKISNSSIVSKTITLLFFVVSVKGKVYSSAYRIKEAKLETKQKKLADVKQIALFYEQFHVYVSLITNFLHFFSKFQVFFITTITLFILFSFFFFSFFSFSFLVLFPFCNNFPLFSLPLLRGNFHLRLYNSSFFYSC